MHMSKDHLQQIENGINYYSKTYENFMLIEDFNAEISDTNMSSSYAIHKFKSLIKEPDVTTILTTQPAYI